MHMISLHQLTVGSTDFTELVRVAAALDCRRICLFTQNPAAGDEGAPGDAGFPVLDDPVAVRAVKRVCRDLGVSVFNIDAFLLSPTFRIEHMLRGLEFGADLGATRATALSFDPDRDRAAANLALLVETARGFGIRVGLEYFGPSQARNPADIMDLIERSGFCDAAITIDTLHSVRNGVLPSSISEQARERIDILQVSDGPLARSVDEVFLEATRDRRVPGEGEFPLAEFLEAVPSEVAISIEVPRGNCGLTPMARAQAAVEATRAWLRGAGRDCE